MVIFNNNPLSLKAFWGWTVAAFVVGTVAEALPEPLYLTVIGSLMLIILAGMYRRVLSLPFYFLMGGWWFFILSVLVPVLLVVVYPLLLLWPAAAPGMRGVDWMLGVKRGTIKTPGMRQKEAEFLDTLEAMREIAKNGNSK